MVSQKIIKELLHYDPCTGIFTWLERDREWFSRDSQHKRWNTRYAGEIAGGIWGNGYWGIRLLGILYGAHRLAFLYMEGAFPHEEADHINGVRRDNRWINLRAVKQGENQKNAAVRKDSASGVTGVYWVKTEKKWQVQIRTEGKTKTVGLFGGLFEAAAARKSAEKKYGYHENHGRKSSGLYYTA